MKRPVTLVLVCTLCLVGRLAFASEVPPDALRAEMAQDWDAAIAAYREALDAGPDRADLWLRLGDVYAAAKRPGEAAACFERAATLRPDDAAAQVKASQAHAVAEDWPAALAAIDRAVALEPENMEYLRARAQLANAAGDAATAADSYERVLTLEGETEATRLAYLRAQTWAGELDEASEGYAAFLESHPAHADALLEAARVELWRGNYSRALELLDAYEAEYGATGNHQRLEARVWARANRSSRAFELLDPLWRDYPDDYDVAYSRTVAFVNGRRPQESVDALEHLEELGQGRPELRDMRRFVMTRLRSNATVGGEYYTDEDEIDIYRVTGEGWYAISPGFFVGGGSEYQELRAERGSGLENKNGDRDADYWDAWLGAKRRFSAEWAGDARIGVGEGDGDEELLYRLGVEYTPQDHMAFRLQQDRVFHTVSPRAVSEDVYQDRTSVWGHYEFDLRHVLDVQASYGAFSDDNDRWEVGIAPRRVVLRREHYNLDVGVSALWFGFDDDLDHGYYDPTLYQRYMLTTFHYWKFSDDDGVSVALAAGVSRDDRTEEFDFAGDAVVEATFGLYREWMLVLRSSTTFSNQSQRDFGDYWATRAGVFLTKRF